MRPVPPAAPLRPAAVVMRPERIGAFHPNRLAFSRVLVRRMAREGWTVSRERFDLDDSGTGTAIYRADIPSALRPVRFAVFARHLDAADRTDRVIADKWDAAFALTEAEPTDGEVARLAANVPRQEAGRCSAREPVLSRANKSVRLFEHTVAALAAGRQPERARLLEAGYLVRTTAVYGNGKFGLADLARVEAETPFGAPFEAEMFCVWLARQFSLDWVEHIARRRAPEAFAPLDPALGRALGVGNATGLGMAPFLVGHPAPIDRWVRARETALARVRALPRAGPAERRRFLELLDRAIRHVEQWPTTDPAQRDRNAVLRAELAAILAAGGAPAGVRPWDRLVRRAAARLSVETQEALASLAVELHPALVDDLAETACEAEDTAIDPAMTLAELKAAIAARYAWALEFDFAATEANALFWYYSEEKSEPRLGARFEEPGADREMPVAVARDVSALHAELAGLGRADPRAPVAEFLLARPGWRETVRRVQALAGRDYAEIRGNLVGRSCRPIDLLRCKLAIFGATKFDPKSDLWTRVALFQGAPTADGLRAPGADDWAFPALAEGIGA